MTGAMHGSMSRCWVIMAVWWAVAPAAAGVVEEPTRAEESAFRAAVERVASAVVRVEPAAPSEAAITAAAEAAPGGGPSTGVVVDGPKGWIVTSAFAVPDDASDAVVVLADGKRLAAGVRARDRSRGLVLLAVDPLPAAALLEPAPRGELAAGQWSIAVGRGWSHATPAISVGIVSAVHRAWGRAVQTDASVSPANYGGPLLDIAGRVIGVLAPLPADTAGMPLGTELYDAGIGFAVPFEDVLRFVGRTSRGEPVAAGILGITYRSADIINGEPVIGSCRQGSPAALAGLRPGDRILRIDGRKVTRVADVRHAIAPRYAGDEVEVVVGREVRGGEPREMTVRITLAEALPPWRRAVLGLLPAARPEADAEGGLDVAWVLPGGPAASAGVAVGDRIDSVSVIGEDGEGEAVAVRSPDTLGSLLAGLDPGAVVELGISRHGRSSRRRITTAAMPAVVPAADAFNAAGDGDPAAGSNDAAVVVRLEGADVARPMLAVMPRDGTGPVGVLVYCAPPRGPLPDSEALAWKMAVARHGIAVVLPGSGDPQQWSIDDVPALRRGLAALHRKRPLDPGRIALAGAAAGGSFAWLAADRLGGMVRGVALLDAVLPRQAKISPAEPGRTRWVLLGPPEGDRARRLEEDRARLVAAGIPLGDVVADGAGPPADLLCRWVRVLGML